LIVDTGGWHYENSKDTQIRNSFNYAKVLGNTKYSLCPRGTGPSTIRIWEAMAMKSHPVILSDFLKMPGGVEHEGDLWSRMPENFNDLVNFSERKEYNNKVYGETFSNDNLYKSILRLL
jgi:hypothetical protein